MATSGNLLLEELIVNDNSQDVHDWIERFELKTDLLIFESSAKLPDDETKRDQAVERLKRTYLLFVPNQYHLMRINHLANQISLFQQKIIADIVLEIRNHQID